jgi:2-oxoglutarate ferredoxin oxidoreductase subunit delta
MSNNNGDKNDFKPVTTENDKVAHTVFSGLCKGCRICQEVCPVKCIHIDEENRGIYNNKTVKIDVDKCIACGKCELHCPERAIRVQKKGAPKTPPPEDTDKK